MATPAFMNNAATHRPLRHPVARYAFALAMVAASIGSRFALMPLLGPGFQYVTVFPLIIVVAIRAGRGPAILHAVLAGSLASWYFSTNLNVHLVFITLIVVFTGFLAGGLVQRLHNAVDQAQRRSGELAESEQKFRLLADNAQAVIGIVQGDRFIYVNPYIEKLSGYTPDEVVRAELWKLIHPDDRQTVLERAKQRQSGKKAPNQYEFKMLTKSGDIRWLDFSPVLITYKGKPAIVGIAFDVTDRKKAQKALADSELFYRQTLESIPGMVFTTRPDGYCDYQSSQWVEYTGVPMEQMIGDGWNKLLHPEDRDRALTAWRQAIEGKAAYDLEYRVRRFDGQYEWFKVRGRPIRDAAGSIVRWFGVAADISDLKKTEAALSDSEARFRGTFENAAVGITLVDLDGNWIAVNQKFCDLVGYSKEALMGTGFTIVTLYEDLEEDRRRFGQLKKGLLDSYSVEKRYLRRDGRVIWVDLYRALQRDQAGRPLYTIAVVIDISERKQAEEALRRSQTLLTEAEKLSHTGAWEWDLVADRWSFSHEWLKIHGLQEGTLTSDELLKMAHPDDRQRIVRALEEVKSGIKAYHIEHRIIRADSGQIRVLRSMGRYVRDFDGKITRVYGFAQDITEQKQAEQALLESERLLRQLADSMPQIVWAARPDGVIDYYNQKWYDITGGSADKIGDESWLPVIHPDDIAMVRQAWAQCVRTGHPLNIECRLKTAAGDYRWHLSRGLPVRDDKGYIIRWFGTATDIHDLKNMQETLRESENRYRTLFESIDEGFCVIEVIFDDLQKPVDFRFLEVNPAFERQTGLRDVQGKSMRLLVPGHEDYWFDVYGKVALTGEPIRFVSEANELSRWYDVFAFRIGRPHEHKVAVLFSDITQFKKAEQDLLRYKDHLENKNKEMESIIGIVSHDLRAPLVNIQGFTHEIELDCKMVDTLLSRVVAEDPVEKQLDALLHHGIPESLGYIQSSSEAMNNLVVTLVEVARAGMAPIKPEKLNMNDVIAHVVESIKIKFREADVEYDLTDLPECFADRTQVTQIFTNLLDNAVKYLDPSRHGQICVEGIPQAGGVLYWVSDNGIGISAEEQEKIFEPYYQLKQKASGGVGLGLATVKRMIDRNNGKIWVISEKGQYSIFYLSLPAVPSP